MTPTQPPAPEAQLTELHLDERGLEFRMKHPIVPIMAEHLAEAFKDAGGVNYVAFDVNCEDIGPLVLIMQRRLGETPEIQVRRMRVELDEARAELATAQAINARETDGNSLYYYNLWMNARSENGELREELQHEREFSRAGATAFANKEAAYASHDRAQATEVATLRATHARQADTIARLTREHAEVIARLEVMRAEVVGLRGAVTDEALVKVVAKAICAVSCSATRRDGSGCECWDWQANELEARAVLAAVLARATTTEQVAHAGGGENG